MLKRKNTINLKPPSEIFVNDEDDFEAAMSDKAYKVLDQGFDLDAPPVLQIVDDVPVVKKTKRAHVSIPQTKLGLMLRSERLRVELSHQDVANEIGIPRRRVAKIEQGIPKVPKLEDIMKFVEFYELDVNAVFKVYQELKDEQSKTKELPSNSPQADSQQLALKFDDEEVDAPVKAQSEKTASAEALDKVIKGFEDLQSTIGVTGSVVIPPMPVTPVKEQRAPHTHLPKEFFYSREELIALINSEFKSANAEKLSKIVQILGLPITVSDDDCFVYCGSISCPMCTKKLDPARLKRFNLMPSLLEGTCECGTVFTINTATFFKKEAK